MQNVCNRCRNKYLCLNMFLPLQMLKSMYVFPGFSKSSRVPSVLHLEGSQQNSGNHFTDAMLPTLKWRAATSLSGREILIKLNRAIQTFNSHLSSVILVELMDNKIRQKENFRHKEEVLSLDFKGIALTSSLAGQYLLAVYTNATLLKSKEWHWSTTTSTEQGEGVRQHRCI